MCKTNRLATRGRSGRERITEQQEVKVRDLRGVHSERSGKGRKSVPSPEPWQLIFTELRFLVNF